MVNDRPTTAKESGMKIPRKIYKIIPGFVTSVFDGDRHYIDHQKLTRLYEVNPAECITPDSKVQLIPNKTIHLGVRPNGDYVEHRLKLEEQMRRKQHGDNDEQNR